MMAISELFLPLRFVAYSFKRLSRKRPWFLCGYKCVSALGDLKVNTPIATMACQKCHGKGRVV